MRGYGVLRCVVLTCECGDAMDESSELRRAQEPSDRQTHAGQGLGD